MSLEHSFITKLKLYKGHLKLRVHLWTQVHSQVIRKWVKWMYINEIVMSDWMFSHIYFI